MKRMSIFSFMRGIFPGRHSVSASARSGYAAASSGRLLADWVLDIADPNALARMNLRTLRARSRDLERNNPYARGFFHQVTSNVIGPKGVALQMAVKNSDGTSDVAANRQIEEAFIAWSARGICTMDGKLSWADAQRLVMRSIARDGEVLIRLVRGRAARNEFGFAIQLVEADHLDETDDRNIANGVRVRSGVEIDEWGRPRAYHIWRDHPASAAYSAAGEKIRLPASEVLHPFILERAGQMRGVPWLVVAMLNLHHLGKYDEAEVVAARVAAGKMGFFEQDPEAMPGGLGDADPASGDLLTEADPGTFGILPVGYKFKGWDPQHPNAQFAEFHRAMLRGVAAGVGASYASISGDLSDTNYSSLRQGALAERDQWRVLQTWATDAFIRPVFLAWLEMAMTSGVLNLPMRKFDKFAQATFQPRGWEWVDPLKEMTAHALGIEMALTSRSGVLAGRGQDFGDLLRQIAAERHLAKEMGVELPKARPKGQILEGSNDEEKDG